MGYRSNSTLERDHQRAIEHRAYLTLQELSTIDWISVEDYELEEIKEQLEDLVSEVENEHMCESLQYLLDLLDSLD